MQPAARTPNRSLLHELASAAAVPAEVGFDRAVALHHHQSHQIHEQIRSLCC
jgi:hypothetical protein